MFFALMSGSAWAFDFQNRWIEKIDGVTYHYDMWYIITDATNHYVEVTCKDANYNSYNESTHIAIPKTVTHPSTGEVYTVTAIGANAFRGCTILQYIYFSDVTSIGDNAFNGCTGLVDLTFTTKILTIGSNAFDGCTGLTSVAIPPQMTSIGGSAFRGCTNLTSVYYNATTCTMGSYIFQNCTSDCTLTIGDDVSGVPACAFYDFPGLKTVNFGSHANFEIGGSAFHACTGLTSIIIPDNVTTIDRFAFDGCTSLAEVTIGAGVVSIGDTWGQTFNNCNNITTIYYNATNCPDLNDIQNSLWLGCNHNCTVYIGDNVTRLPMNIFKGLTNLNTIVFGSNPSLMEIGDWAFENTGLTSVTIPNSVTTIGGSAFSGCTALASLDLGSVQTIETHAFYNCTSLTSLTIPATVTLIEAASWEGNGAFRDCSGLTEIWFMGAKAPVITNRAVFQNVPSNIPVYVPKGYPTTGAYSYFSNYKPYLRFVGGNSSNNWTVASNWTGACTQQEQSQEPSSLNMVLTNANMRDAKPIDNAIVSFGEGNGMPKFEFGEQDANIYIPQDGKDYAIVYSDGQGVMPLNFKANVDGEYTITVSETLSSQFSVLRLIDHLTGANVDLLATPSYQFTARKSDYASRFKLVFHANGIEENTEDDEEFVFFSDGQLFINGTETLQVIDMQGRQLFNREVNSSLLTLHSPPAFTY